jgi:hypothetical protein
MFFEPSRCAGFVEPMVAWQLDDFYADRDVVHANAALSL